MFTAHNLSFSRGNRSILTDITCALAPGKITALLGPNGAGKSTLFKIFTGELEPKEGRVAFDGKDLTHWKPNDLAKRRSALPQENFLTFPFKVIEVVTLGRFPHSPNGETRVDLEIASEALNLVDLQGFEERRFTQLSGGEKQRVQLARALAQIWATAKTQSKSALLLDEPTANLDPSHQIATLQIAREMADRGNAVLAILHDMNLALSYADDLWALKHGCLIADGPIEEMLTPELAQILFNIDCESVTLPNQNRPQLFTLTNAS